MKMNVELNENQIPESESMTLNSEPLIGVICQQMHQICTTSIKIKSRIIQKRKRKRNAAMNPREENPIENPIENSIEMKQCLSQLLLIEQLFNDLQHVKELVSLLDDQLIIYGF
ncbi:unnamed protein product [Paramecium octaurelia]|uniref:Uncharacterized protein n=1 Tax=Paramecium octaurelia TaxID=43137 RepID=A0A8S1TCM5_PAROT|nr:unnamed protein product [Paramecium octaurelia]